MSANGFKDTSKETKIRYTYYFGALKDKDTPIEAKIFAGITVVYALSPIDLVSDFIAGVLLKAIL